MRTANPPLLALQRQRPGSFALLIAATSLLMLLAAALALTLHAAARDITAVSAGRLLVQIADADPTARDTTTDDVLRRLDQAPGLVSVHRVPDREAQALIQPYIGGVSPSDLPLPTMIDVRARNDEAIVRAVAGLPTVRVTRVGAELGALERLIAALRSVAIGIALTAATATGLIAMLAARAALAREAATLGILHALGATDGQISRLVAGKIARDAGIGAALGLAAALLLIWGIGRRVAAISAGFGAGLGTAGWITLLLLPLSLIALAVGVGQAALLSALRRAP